MFDKEIAFIKELFKGKDAIALHEPCFIGNEKAYLARCIDSGFVSSVGEFVGEFEKKIAEFVGAKFAVAMNSGTSALHIALLANGVDERCEVITQSISFVATANAISYTGAKPIFLDIDEGNLSLSPKALREFLEQHAFIKDGQCFNKTTQKCIKACVPMHSFGLSAHISDIKAICDEFHLTLIEDAAEALGSFYANKALGLFGKCGIFSFNGNKTITGGCGGVLISNDEQIAKFARHLSTTAKIPHPYRYEHDYIGYNYRLCNINAALLVAQLENLPLFLDEKRKLAKLYKEFFAANENFVFVDEMPNSKSNFWLNTLIAKDERTAQDFIESAHKANIFVRGAWDALPSLKMYQNCQKDELSNTKKLEKRIVSLPSSVRKECLNAR